MRAPEATVITPPAATTMRSAEPEQSTLTENSGRLVLVNPIIEFAGYVFIDPADSRTQQKRATPKRAYIDNGMLVIEEYGIAMPLSAVALIRFGTRVVTK